MGWGMEMALGQFGAGPEMWVQILTLYLHFIICQRRMKDYLPLVVVMMLHVTYHYIFHYLMND